MVASRSPERFRLGLGHPALEFVATCAGRRRAPVDRLASPSDLEDWLALTGLAAGASCTPRQLDQARNLREATYRLLEAARAKEPPTVADLEMVNAWARRPRQILQLDDAFRVQQTGPSPCTIALTELARATVELISGPELERIRNCADPTCSLMFIDRSHPGRRRWCSMERCGNRAKTARYRHQRLADHQRS